MRFRTIVSMSPWFKLGLLIACGSILYIHHAWGDYFSTALSDAQQRESVAAALDVDARNDRGLTGLMFAAINGERELARALIDRGAHLNLISPDEKETALHYAVNNLRAAYNADVGYILIDAYANTRMVNKYGQQPLHLVLSTDVLQDREKMVDALMKNGADINAQTAQGDTLLHLAVNMQAYNWVPLLLERYGSLMSRTIKNKKGLTPKEYAVQLGHGDMAKMIGDTQQPLIAPGVYDKYGLTGLMLAIMGNDNRIIESYARFPGVLDLLSKDEYRNSALHVAMLQENVNAVKSLIAHGANVMIRNAKGEPAVQYIVRVGDPVKKISILEMLLKKSPSTILAQNNRGDTLVHYLVRFDDQKSFEYLYRNYRTLLEQALTIKNNALETPGVLATRFSRSVLIKAMQILKEEIEKQSQ